MGDKKGFFIGILKKQFVFRWLSVVVFLVVGVCPYNVEAVVRVSEIQASNEATLQDFSGDYPDWVELHNTGPESVNLIDWYLTDNPLVPTKWSFPILEIPAGEYRVVFLSGKNGFEPSEPGDPEGITRIHVNFKLSGGGEYLGLVMPDGETVVSAFDPKFPPQLKDVSYGIDGGEYQYFVNPTPGEVNIPGTGTLGPIIRDLLETLPPIDESADEAVITAQISSVGDLVNQVRLYYRVNYGNERNTLMRDDGESPDAIAGDNIYSGRMLFHSLTSIDAGDMVRWRVTAQDTRGRSSRMPLYNDPVDSPEYFGTIVYDDSIETSNLKVLHWFVEDPEDAGTETGTRGSVYFLGEFYDNIQTDRHGGSTKRFEKKSYDLDFNRGYRFRYDPKEKRVKDVNLLTNFGDKTKSRNTIAYEVFRESGAPAHFAFAVRVQQNGEFFSVADMVEDGDDRYLERAGLDPRGALYKVYNNYGLVSTNRPDVKKNPKDNDFSDYEALGDVLRFGATEAYLFDNIDIAGAVNFLAATVIVENGDFNKKNFYMYRDTFGSGEWSILPWDLDLTFGHKWVEGIKYFDDTLYYDKGIFDFDRNELIRQLLENSRYKKMFLRRLRTLMDVYLQPSDTPIAERYFERRLDEMVALIDPPGIVSDADLDYDKWDRVLTRPPIDDAWAESEKNRMVDEVERVKNEYINRRRNFLYSQVGVDSSQIPFPEPDGLFFQIDGIDFNPLSGNQEEEYIRIINHSIAEIDISGWTLSGAIEFTFPAGSVVLRSGSDNSIYVAKNRSAFRSRSTSPRGGEGLFVVGDYKGHLSARGETITLTNRNGEVMAEQPYVGNPSDVQEYLRISEINFAPNGDRTFPASDFEYVELCNIGDAPLDLSGVQFVSGIIFAFPNEFTLEPGEYALVVGNLSAFESRYGTGLNVAGVFEGNLNNGGDTLRLIDSVGEHVFDFKYEGEWYSLAQDAAYAL